MKKVKTSIYLNEELLDKLKELATKEGRSLNNLIELLLKQSVEK